MVGVNLTHLSPVVFTLTTDISLSHYVAVIMECVMFGFSKNKNIYIEKIGSKLRKEYKIDIHIFPSAIEYSKLVETAWAAKMNEDEAVMSVAVSYFLFLCKGGSFVDASDILFRIENIAGYVFPREIIREKHWLVFSNAISEGRAILGIK